MTWPFLRWTIGILFVLIAMEMYWLLNTTNKFVSSGTVVGRGFFRNMITRPDTPQLPVSTIAASTAERQCYTNHCPGGRPNKIILQYLGPNGLSDRRYMFETLSNLAGYLCANLYVPSPAILLLKEHNQEFLTVNVSLPWTEFFEITSLEDMSPVMIMYTNVSDVLPHDYKPDNHILFIRNVGDQCEQRATSDFEKIEQFWLQSINTSNTNYTNNTIVQQPRAFVWSLHCSFYQWLAPLLQFLNTRTSALDKDTAMQKLDSSLLPLHMKNCDYIQSQYSSTIHRIANKVWERLYITTNTSLHSTLFATFHVRRRHVAVTACNTSVEALQQYLSCSLQYTSALTRSMILLFSSDEPDTSYRQSVLKLPQYNTSDFSHVHIVDLDQIAVDTLFELIASGTERDWLWNNFVVFAVVQAVQDQTWIHLSKRRDYMCNPCDRVVEQILAHQQKRNYWSYKCFPNMYCGLVPRIQHNGA
jgi:hypothetical protein